MKYFLIILFLSSIIFFNQDKITLSEITFIKEKYFNRFNSELIEKIEKKPSIKIENLNNIKEVYLWEFMFLYIDQNYLTRTTKEHHPFHKFILNISKQRTFDLKRLENFFNINNINHELPILNIYGKFDFKRDNINKAFDIFINVESKNDMYRNLCISYNSLIFKYSELIRYSNSKYEYDLFQELEDKNIEKLLFINSTLKKISINGCCEISNILCSAGIEKTIDIFSDKEIQNYFSIDLT